MPASRFLTSAFGFIALMGGMAASAQPRNSSAAPKPAAQSAPAVEARTAPEMSSADVEAFLDGVMPLQLQRADIAGAVVAVVKDGKVIFAKGYGYSDVEKKKPVSPNDTLFRPGSISKLFTWTAVMQLVEQGKLDLDRDVNDYLDFKIPATYPQPITLRNIMTHTSGFEESIKGLIVDDPKTLTSLRTYLVDHMPARIFPPGTTPAYSNYATTVAGYIVERVSGKPFNEYVATNILQPLGMSHTTFEQPLPAALKPLMSNGYSLASDKVKPYEIVAPWPAGSVATSAMDMTHFMIAHLQNGEYNGAHILRPETAQLMHARQFGPNPATNAMALGFYEETRNGHRIIGHGGDTVFFHSDLHLIPDAGVGFFVSYNSAGKGEISNRTALFEQFLDRYFPYTIPTATAPATAVADAKSVSGLYMVSRRPQGNILEAIGMLSELRVTALPDGKIMADEFKGFNGKPKKFTEIAPLVYREVDGQDKLAFKRNNGTLQLAIDYPFMVFDQVGLLQNKVLNYCVLCGSLGIMLLALIFWPVNGWLRRHYATKLALNPTNRRLRLFTRLVCAINIVFVVLLGVVLAGGDGVTSLSGIDGRLHALQVLGVIGCIGALLALYNAIRTWRHQPAAVVSTMAAAASDSSAATSSTSSPSAAPQQHRPSRIFEALVALSCLGLTWFLLYWNILNFNLHY